MESTLEFAAFTLPDDWRDTSTYQYSAPDAAGTLVVEVSHENRDATELLQEARDAFLGVWGPAVIYHDEFPLQRPTQPAIVGLEGEQTSIDGRGRLRFAVVPLVSSAWAAVLTFVLRPRRDFLSLVRAVTASFAFADEPALAIAPPTLRRRVRAYGAQLDVPSDWATPRTLEFLDRQRDDVQLRVTIDEPRTPPGTIRWQAHLSGTVQVVREDVAPARDGWSAEWWLERPPPHASPHVFRKAVIDMGASRTVTLYGSAPASVVGRLDVGWNALRATLGPAGAG